MQEVCGNIKTLLADMQGKGLSSTAKLVAILESCGIQDRAEIENLLEARPSTIREARAALKIQRRKSSADDTTARNPAPEIQRQNSSDRQNSSVGTFHAIAHATKESPTEISFTNVKQQQQHAADVVDAKLFCDQLFEAGGNALSDIAIGLKIISEPLGWVQSGADIEIDILPTIAVVASRRPARSISSWSYFSQAVSNAKNARLKGLPAAQPVNVLSFHRPTDTAGRPMPTPSEAIAKIMAEEAAHATG